MEEERSMICERCKKSVPINKIKYAKKGDDSYLPLCIECIKMNEEKPKKRPMSDNPNKERYRCLRCKYTFKHDTRSERNLACPFCGKNDKIIEDKLDASALLRDVDDDNFINKI